MNIVANLMLPRRIPASLALIAAVVAPSLAAENSATGSTTGLPVPRYVSLKPSDTPMREGPSKDHRIKWVFKREGLPVEITAESDTWRRVRDSEGTEGWVFHSRLSSRRTGLVAPWSKEAALPLYERESDGASVVARLQPSVLANIENCNGRWCRVNGEGFRGWIKQESLWGVYPGESVR